MYNQNIKADAGKIRLSLVPTEIIRAIAMVREYGSKKYSNHNNWQQVEQQRYVDAAYRHWLACVDDINSVDKESGLPHLWHMATNIAFLIELNKNVYDENINK